MSNRNEEERNEWRNELLEEAKADERHECDMRNDYDYFLEQLSSEIEELSELYADIKKAHNEYGHEFDLESILV